MELYNAIVIWIAKAAEKVDSVAALLIDPTLQTTNAYGGFASITNWIGIIGTIVIAIVGKPGVEYAYENVSNVSQL